jgi:uncharacterized protein with HEPN domain
LSRLEIDRLRDIIEAMDKAENAVRGFSLDTFAEVDTLFAALCHYVLIVSEASRHIPTEKKAAFPEIEWRDIADTGNFIRHVYFKVSPARIWNTCQNEFPKQRPVIERMIAELNFDR